MPTYPQTPALQLETCFRQIAATRMHGVELLNSRLTVEAIGFRRWQDMWVGVLLTPWFMNLMLLPAEDNALPAVEPGAQVELAFPGGEIPFMAGSEAALGDYRWCSLVSPVDAFQDQQSARTVAEECLELLFPPIPAVPDPSRRRLFGLKT